MLHTVSHHRDAAVYVGARMFFVDGMNGVLVYAGVFAVGVMKWGALEMLAYGILLSMFAVLGGFVGRWLDAALGPKNAVAIEILMSMVGLTAFLGMAPDTILFFWPYDAAAHPPLWDGPVFQSWPDVIFVLVGQWIFLMTIGGAPKFGMDTYLPHTIAVAFVPFTALFVKRHYDTVYSILSWSAITIVLLTVAFTFDPQISAWGNSKFAVSRLLFSSYPLDYVTTLFFGTICDAFSFVE